MLRGGALAGRTQGRPTVRVGAVVAIALAAGLGAWLALQPSPDHRAAADAAPDRSVPRIVSSSRLRALAARLGHPLYWVGARPGMRYELTQAAGGRTYVRYLPRGAEAGDRRPLFLAIGTYSLPDAFRQTRAATRRTGAVALFLSDGGIAVYNRARPTNVYFAYPGSSVQVEVFTPSAATARRLVLGGRVVPDG